MTALMSSVLAMGSTATVTNFYLDDSDDGGDFDTTAAQRRQSLTTHIAQTAGGDLVFVGEAAGYQGARQSGVAFTSAPMVGLVGDNEPSAIVVHKVLATNRALFRTLLWNALPLHPHKLGEPSTNRNPYAAERRSGLASLEYAIAGRRILCIGQQARASVSELLHQSVPDVTSASYASRAIAVRHPSYGGAVRFSSEAADALALWGVP